MATSLGEGIGLQSGDRSNYWSGRTADLGIRNANQKREDEKELIKLSEFNIDYSKLLPVYGHSVAAKQQAMYNDIVKMRQDNPGTPRGAIIQRIQKAKQDMAIDYISNAQAMEYLSKPGIKKRPELARAFTAMDTTPEKLRQFDDGLFHRIGPNGEFSYTAVNDNPVGVKFDLNTDFVETEKPTKKFVDNKRLFEIERRTSPESVKREAAALYNNPDYQAQVLFDNPQITQLPLEQQADFIRLQAWDRAMGEAPKGFTKQDWKTIPQGDGSGADKVTTPTFNPPSTRNITVFNSDRKAEPKTSSVEVPFSINVANTPAVEIPISDKIFDVKTNRPITREPGFETGNITFKTSTILPSKRNDGSWSDIAVGKVQMMGQPNENGITPVIKELDVEIPLDMVESVVKSKYDLSEYEKKSSDLKGRKEQSTSWSGTYKIKGKTYSAKQLQEMGYTQEQVASYKQ